jgi:hypothetical protein
VPLVHYSAPKARRRAAVARLIAARVDSESRSALRRMKSWIVPLKRTDVVGTPASRSFVGVGLALVSQHVVLVNDDEGRRQTFEVGECRLQW